MKLYRTIEHFAVRSEYNESRDKCERYEGHFTIFLRMGKLNWDVPREVTIELTKRLKEKDLAFSVVYASFSHHGITAQYIFEKDCKVIFNEFVKVYRNYVRVKKELRNRR